MLVRVVCVRAQGGGRAGDSHKGVACIAAQFPFFLYPFLNTVSKARPFEYLRLTSLGVIGALVKVRVRTHTERERERK
jgi:hypothetical protein